MVLLEYFLVSLVGVHSVSGYVTAWPSSSDPHQVSLGAALEHPDRSSSVLTSEQLESWISQQRKTSWRYLLDNIAPGGLNAARAAAGTVIASPSKSYPNYFYQWVRDAAITMKGVVGEYEKTKDVNLRDVVEQYVRIQGMIQGKANPSGGYYSGGLGEPKFMVDGEPFVLPWSRPQRDGPALRILTLTGYIKALNGTHPELVTSEWLRKLYNPKLPSGSIIKADLEYISHTWSEPGFDLWEETKDLHFFTALVQHKALVEGRDLAGRLGDRRAAAWYDQQQAKLKQFLVDRFWSHERGHLRAYLNTHHRTGLDCGLMLGAIHGGQSEVFAPWSDEVLVSMQMLVDDMGKRFSVNRRSPPYHKEDEKLRGVGIGRYPEDIYDGVGFSGGHPWFLCTSSVSDILYSTIKHFVDQGALNITAINLPFFNRLHPTNKAELGVVTSDDLAFYTYLHAMFTYADSFLNVIRWHASRDGRLSEQFDGTTGFQRGAHDLTWSYGSFLEATEKRDRARESLEGKKTG